MKFHNMPTNMVPESPLLEPVDEATEDGDWRQVSDCLPLSIREMLLGGYKVND